MTESSPSAAHTSPVEHAGDVHTYRLATIGGDGIGPEVLDEALRCVDATSSLYGFGVQFTPFDAGSSRYLRTGEVLTDEDLRVLETHDAILLGAVGDPRVTPGVLERGLIVRIRMAFELAVNVRPAQLFRGIPTLIRDLTPERCDLVIVRENTEGMYASGGVVAHEGTPYATATQLSVNTKPAITDAVEFAFELARQRRGHLTLCHKTNILLEAGRLWSNTVDEVAARYPDVHHDYVHADACSVHLVERPEIFDVIVTDNLFGDLLSDLAAVIQGGMGLAPSANLNVHGRHPSMFEPVHGSAPDIAGTGGANPAGAIFAAAMCLSYLGEHAAAAALERATIQVLATLPAMRGSQMGCTTREIGERVCEALTLSGEPGEVGTYRSRTVVGTAKGRTS